MGRMFVKDEILEQITRNYLKLCTFESLTEYQIFEIIGKKLNLHYMTVSDHLNRISRFKAKDLDIDFALSKKLISQATAKKIL